MGNYNLLLNIVNGIKYLQEDFIFFSLNPYGVLRVLLNIVISLIIVLTFYLLGKKIRHKIFRKSGNKNLNFFIEIPFGYIFVGSGIALLGLFSLLYDWVLIVFLACILFISFYPFSNLFSLKVSLYKFLQNIKHIFNTNKLLFFAVLIFLLISFLRLIPPEIGEDSIGYHTDLPRLYLKNHSMILPSKEPQRTLPSPQLGEMSYMITEFLGFRDASRYIHFTFYTLIVLLLIYWKYNKKNNFVGLYSALLFMTASVVIRHSSKANVDYQWMYCWLISIIVLVNNNKLKASNIVISSILFGGVMATKLWTIAFLPVFLVYILIKSKITKSTVKYLSAFLLGVFSIPFLWYLRSFIITGNPFFPAFLKSGSEETNINFVDIFFYIGFNSSIFNYSNLTAFSPLFFLSVIFILPNLISKFKTFKEICRGDLFLFFSVLIVENIFIKYYLGRYLMGTYLISVIIVAMASDRFLLIKNIVFKLPFNFILAILISYYFLSTLIILPYGFGWADKNKYLTRVLYRDNSSYYNFDNLFDKWMDNDDVVATHGVFGFYYANFPYIDDNYIFDKKNKSFSLLKQKGITKLLIKGGNILWYCQKLSLTNCNGTKVSLLATYPKDVGKYNLYDLADN